MNSIKYSSTEIIESEGKKLNKYAYDGKAFDQKATMEIINETHLQYRKLKMTQKKLKKLALD